MLLVEMTLGACVMGTVMGVWVLWVFTGRVSWVWRALVWLDPASNSGAKRALDEEYNSGVPWEREGIVDDVDPWEKGYTLSLLYMEPGCYK